MLKTILNILVLICFFLSACSIKSHRSILKNKPEVLVLEKSDSFLKVQHWKTLIPKRFYESISEIIIKKDSTWVKSQKWVAYGRISPNALQKIYRTELLYVKDTFAFEKNEIINLLMFDSSYKTKTRYRLKNGEIKTTEKEGPYDEMLLGLDGTLIKEIKPR